MKSSELCVPASAFAIGDDGKTMPGEGETVEFTGRGTVRMKGDKAYVTASEINGQPVEMSKAPASLEDEEADMREDAMETDKASGLY